MNGKIGVFDSGLGGLSILKAMVDLLPHENYLFYEDSINNPYGEKSDSELLKISSKIVEYLLDNDCKIIVIACNTATTSCMLKLRELYPNTIFVGTVPAIKMAYDMNCQSTLVLSTDYTKKSKRVNELLLDYQHDSQEVINISGKELAHLIELDKKKEIKELLKELLLPYKDRIDSIVLGCTHYSLIKDEISEILPDVLILDSCLGVAKEVRRQLSKNSLLSNSVKKGKAEIINSKDDNLVERSYKILQLQ